MKTLRQPMEWPMKWKAKIPANNQFHEEAWKLIISHSSLQMRQQLCLTAYTRQSRGVDPPVQIRRGERAQRRGCQKTSGFLSRETGISGNFVGRIKGAKCPFDLQFLTWDFS